MKTLLYFEEYESDLSKALRKRKDINVLFIRTDKNIRFFSNEYLEKHKDYYQFFYDNDFDMEIHKFKNWLNHKKIKIDYFLNVLPDIVKKLRDMSPLYEEYLSKK